MERAAANIYYDANKKIDLIDVFDWHFIPAAVTLKNGLGIPFVYSVESLEDHRSPTANSSYNMAIKSIEWLGFYEAQMVSVKSEWMKDEIIRIYKVPTEKIEVISADSDTWIKDVLELYSKVAEAKKNASINSQRYDAQLGVSAQSHRRHITPHLLLIQILSTTRRESLRGNLRFSRCTST